MIHQIYSCLRNQRILIVLFTLIFSTSVSYKINAQQVSGEFFNFPNKQVKLQAFQNFDTYTVATSQTDDLGKFMLSFSPSNYGIGIFSIEGLDPVILILNKEIIELELIEDDEKKEIRAVQGEKNIFFRQYSEEQPKREQALNAWNYLHQKYTSDSHFNSQKNVIKHIEKEMNRLKNEESNFLNTLEKNNYLSWYIPLRKLVGSVAQVAQYQPERIPETRKALQEINYADERLYKSGLLREAIENHIWFIENSSGGLDQVYKDLNESIATVIDQLKGDDEKLNLVAQAMFEVLEQRSLFTSSEYLSKQLLNQDDCGCLDEDFEKRLQKYGKMATGETAPDIVFTEDTFFPKGVSANKMSDLDADYYLVVFAAGWCGHCLESIPRINQMYPDLMSKNVEVVMVSLDDSSNSFAQFASSFSFISTTDFQKWNSKMVEGYQVYATPSYFMLDNELKILMKFNSIEHIKSWIDSKLKE